MQGGMERFGFGLFRVEWRLEEGEDGRGRDGWIARRGEYGRVQVGYLENA